jgi:retron-type reverse transcriptase
MFFLTFKIKTFKDDIALTTKALRFITQLLITLSGNITSLIIDLYHLVEPLIKKLSGLITCRGKPRFVLKGCRSDVLACKIFIAQLYFSLLLVLRNEKILVQSCMINKLEYGAQIRSIHASSSLTKKNIAPKKQVENPFFLNKTDVDKPFSVKKYVVSRSFALSKLRRRCNGVYPACLLVDFFVRTKMLSREFSATAGLESDRLKRSILEDLGGEKWPSDCIIKRKAITDFVQNVQKQILPYKREQRLDFIASHVFDIRNRIFAIDNVFNKSKSSCYGQVGYSDLTLKSHKFILLKQTKLSNLSKLPPCKIVMVEIPKANGCKGSLGINMPIDRVLQRMFLNFLDVLVEEKLKPEVFAYRKGRDARMAVASVYAKLNRAKYLEQMCLCSVDIEKCFDSILHNQIIEQYPFPKSCSFLLSRWLAPSLIYKNRDFKNLGKVNRGVPRNSILGPSISNLLLSNALPENVFKEKGKDRRKTWAEIFSYSDDIVLIANDSATFYVHLAKLRKNLKKIGLLLNNKKTKSFVNIKNKIKFQFLGFEFLVMPREQLKKSSLLSNMENLHSMKEGSKGFGIILRPSPVKVKGIKKRLKAAIKRILHKPRKEIYKSFQQINSILLGWGSYYYFSQGCTYGKRIDNYLFKYLRKILVKKFRYNGLLRPKWVAYNFLGLGKVNPNGNKWQPQALQYVKGSSKVAKYIYIWYCGDSFSRLSITSFLLNSKLRKKNYYVFKNSYKESLNKLVTRRLKSDLKVKLYGDQSGICLVCKEQMDEKQLLVRSSKLHIHHLVPRSVSTEIGLKPKSYESRNNKILLHEKCHLVLHKSKQFQDSLLLPTSVPKSPIKKPTD